MKHALLFTFITAFLGTSVDAQMNPELKFKKFKLSDFQFTGYFTSSPNQLVEYTTIRDLASNPEELALPDSIDSYTRRETSQEGSQGSAAVIASFSFNPFNKERGEYNERQVWRIGLAFRGMKTFESSYNKSTSSPGMDSTIVDVTESRDYFVNASQTGLMLETSYSFSSDPTKPVKAFIGVGAQFGYTIGSRMEVNSNTNIITQYIDESETVFTPNNFNVNGKNSMLWGVFIPAGVHIRVRKNLGVVTEVRYGLTGNNSSAISFTRSTVYAGVGLRFTLGTFEDKQDGY